MIDVPHISVLVASYNGICSLHIPRALGIQAQKTSLGDRSLVNDLLLLNS